MGIDNTCNYIVNNLAFIGVQLSATIGQIGFHPAPQFQKHGRNRYTGALHLRQIHRYPAFMIDVKTRETLTDLQGLIALRAAAKR